MTSPYTEAFKALSLTGALLDALYDLAVDSDTLGSSDPEAMQLMAMLEVAREKAHKAAELHEAEWKLSCEHRDEAA
ncbi:hypothetical protein [Roseovarius sp.]|uniref:hypothetical protein n=1 Tax=Roseovarius sp. TaxID=1486281 RepID=UPI003BAC4223